MKRLLNKKGFSLVELIVVIAIIAIIMAIVIPIFSTSSSFEKEARENARAFYSNVQQAMVQEKFNKTLLSNADPSSTPTPTNKKYTLIYVEINTANGTDSTVKIGFTDDELKGSRDPSTVPTFTELKECDDTYLPSLKEFSGTIEKLLRTNKHDGYYYALVDDKYRVVSAYYSIEGDYDKLINGKKFSKDFRVEYNGAEYITGAYPYTLLDKDDPVFVDPDA